VAAQTPEGYEAYVRVLRLPEAVTGYREIRYPKMVAAREQAAEWLRDFSVQIQPQTSLVPV
jgi:indolepyruvate ferredoxin oxidoreductase